MKDIHRRKAASLLFLRDIIYIVFLGSAMPLLAQTCARPEPESDLDDAPFAARDTAESSLHDVDDDWAAVCI
jgi:hypothetical protein